MDIVFLITTYNRQDSCQRLVDALQGQGDIVVIGDGCDYTVERCKFINLQGHNGKCMYWLTVKRLFAMRGKHKYYFMLPDDFMPVPNMATKAIEVWESINDPLKICLSIGFPRSISCWTRFDPVDMGNVLLSQWVDMCFLSGDEFFGEFILRGTHIGNGMSSGVGAQISKKLYKSGFHLYQVKESLVIPQEEHSISQMHNKDNNGDSRHSNNKRKRVFDTRRNRQFRGSCR